MQMSTIFWPFEGVFIQRASLIAPILARRRSVRIALQIPICTVGNSHAGSIECIIFYYKCINMHVIHRFQYT